MLYVVLSHTRFLKGRIDLSRMLPTQDCRLHTGQARKVPRGRRAVQGRSIRILTRFGHQYVDVVRMKAFIETTPSFMLILPNKSIPTAATPTSQDSLPKQERCHLRKSVLRLSNAAVSPTPHPTQFTPPPPPRPTRLLEPRLPTSLPPRKPQAMELAPHPLPPRSQNRPERHQNPILRPPRRQHPPRLRR